jgi:hypothetical protein
MRIHFYCGKHEQNMHGTQAKGKPWNAQTLRGPKVRCCKLELHQPSIGYRFVFYFPSGKWWSFDISLDRRVR